MIVRHHVQFKNVSIVLILHFVRSSSHHHHHQNDDCLSISRLPGRCHYRTPIVAQSSLGRKLALAGLGCPRLVDAGTQHVFCRLALSLLSLTLSHRMRL
jgi:hypothetical protein